MSETTICSRSKSDKNMTIHDTMKNNLINNQDKHKKIIMLHSSY